MERTLKLGTAYHGGRFLHQVEQDMRDIARHNMNTVVHMYTHNDWTRRTKLMKDIVKASTSETTSTTVYNGWNTAVYTPTVTPGSSTATTT